MDVDDHVDEDFVSCQCFEFVVLWFVSVDASQADCGNAIDVCDVVAWFDSMVVKYVVVSWWLSIPCVYYAGLLDFKDL